MDKIIKPNQYKEHNVQKYQFKKFDDFNETDEIKKETKSQKQKSDQQPQQHQTQNISEQNNNNQFIKEVLKKYEETLLNIKEIKEQLKKQQDELETRVEKESKIAFELGKEEGVKQITQELEEQNIEIKEQFIKSLELLTQQQNKIDTLINKMEQEIPQLAITIAKKVIEKELDENSSQIAKQITQDLLKNFTNEMQITIKVNPINYQELKESYKENKYIKIEPDDAITKGGVVIISDHENIDADIPTRVQKVINLIEKDY